MEVARLVAGKGTTKNDSESHFARLHHKAQLVYSLRVVECSRHRKKEKLASAEQRVVNLQSDGP